jgi:hypothetical protein
LPPFNSKKCITKSQVVKKDPKNNKKWKKVKKNSLAFRINSLALHRVFCGQTALSLRPYDYNARITKTGYLHRSAWLFEKVNKNRSYV